MNAAELDAIRARVAAGVPAGISEGADDRRVLLTEVEMLYRAAERFTAKVHDVRIVLHQIEDSIRFATGRDCGICYGTCCRSSDQPVSDGLQQLRLIVGPR